MTILPHEQVVRLLELYRRNPTKPRLFFIYICRENSVLIANSFMSLMGSPSYPASQVYTENLIMALEGIRILDVFHEVPAEDVKYIENGLLYLLEPCGVFKYSGVLEKNGNPYLYLNWVRGPKKYWIHCKVEPYLGTTE